MRIPMIASLALVLAASAARAQSLADLTAATGINNTLDANGANSASRTRDTITRKLQASTTSASGKGGWEEAAPGHGGSQVAASGKSGGWASNRGDRNSSGWARGGAQTPHHR
jgi:hypothetical protein